ncbi:MFS transporter [Lutimaribacter marinistellae]|uniref:MFS transporter n=1 Tax=Lutimaribacter marinistellae TaxID=1820329 RepID=A0ABV7TF71_9RHOB
MASNLITPIGTLVDRAWIAIGLDFDGFARRNPDRARRVGIWCLAIGETIGYAGLYYVFSALLFSWDAKLTWGKEWLTFAFMAAVLAGAGVSPLAGRLVDRGVGRWLLSGGMAMGALALFALGWSQSYAAFFLCWLVIGAAQGASLYEPCFAFITRTTGAAAARNITLITLVAGFASTIAFPSGAFLAEVHGWRTAVWTFAAVVGFVGVPLLYAGATMIECCPEDTRTPESIAQDRDAFRAARARPEFWLLFAAFPLIGLTEGLLLAHIIPILTDSGLSLGQAVAASALFGPMQVAGRLAMMLLSGRVKALAMAAMAFCGVLVAVLLLMQVDKIPVAAFAFSLVFGASYGLISILKPVVTADVLGRRAFGAISGFMAVPFLIALATSPQIGAVLWRVGGYDLALVSAAGIAALALVTLFALIGRLKHQG